MNFVLFFEGTGNSRVNPSVVSRLYRIMGLQKGQARHLLSGSGTTGSCLYQFLGEVAGFDTFSIVAHHYKWLTRWMRRGAAECSDAKLFLFGFSRGGFQATLFADLIHKIGVPRHERWCWLMILLYMFGLSRVFAGLGKDRAIKIRYVGLVDSVRSCCFPLNPQIPQGVECRHAVAIHEARQFFSPRLASDIEQRWFLGVHSDVGWAYNGSGYTKCLGKIVADWITEPIVTGGLLLWKRLPDKPIYSLAFLTELMGSTWWIMHDSSRDISNLFGSLRDKPRSVDMTSLHKTASAIRRVIESVDVFSKDIREDFFKPMRSQRFLKYMWLDDEETYHKHMDTLKPHMNEIASVFYDCGLYEPGGMIEFNKLISSSGIDGHTETIEQKPKEENHFKSRDLSLDVIRCVMNYMIVILHAWAAFQYVPWGCGEFVVWTFICSHVMGMAVPTFFLISGYLLFKGFTVESWPKKMTRRIKRLAVPYVAWNLTFVAFYLALSHLVPRLGARVASFGLDTFSGAFSKVLSLTVAPIDGPLWFIRALLIFSLLSPALWWLMRFRKGVVILTCTTIWCVGESLLGLKEALAQTLPAYAIFCFVAGGIVAKNGKDIVDMFSSRWWLAIGGAACVAGAAVSIPLLRANLGMGKLGLLTITILSVLEAPAMISLFGNLKTTCIVQSKFYSFLQQMSFFAYASHFLFCSMWLHTSAPFLSGIGVGKMSLLILVFVGCGMPTIAGVYALGKKTCPRLLKLFDGTL